MPACRALIHAPKGIDNVQKVFLKSVPVPPIITLFPLSSPAEAAERPPRWHVTTLARQRLPQIVSLTPAVRSGWASRASPSCLLFILPCRLLLARGKMTHTPPDPCWSWVEIISLLLGWVWIQRYPLAETGSEAFEWSLLTALRHGCSSVVRVGLLVAGN